MRFPIALAVVATALIAVPAKASPLAASNVTHRLLAAQAGCIHTFPNVDLPNNDLGSSSEKQSHNCWNYCQKVPGCVATTWTSYNGGTCWHKSSFTQGAAVVNGAVTQIVFPTCDRTFITYYNCDFGGPNFAQIPGSNYRECDRFCATASDCRGYTWSDYRGGTCWLKNKVTPCQYAQNKYSGSCRT